MTQHRVSLHGDQVQRPLGLWPAAASASVGGYPHLPVPGRNTPLGHSGQLSQLPASRWCHHVSLFTDAHSSADPQQVGRPQEAGYSGGPVRVKCSGGKWREKLKNSWFETLLPSSDWFKKAVIYHYVDTYLIQWESLVNWSDNIILN